MKITYKNKTLQKVCTDYSAAIREYGEENAQKIHMRIDEISATPNVETMIQYHIGRCHKLKGNRSNQYAVDLAHPYRMVFTVNGTTIQIAKIIEIVDYH